MGFGFGLFPQVLDGTDQEAARAAGGIQDGFAQPRIDLFDDELGDGSRRVEFAGVACRKMSELDLTKLSPQFPLSFGPNGIVSIFNLFRWAEKRYNREVALS